ncbi:hypothetical protein AeMF1_021852 [Aphanomyces euteiches]|nr:hypothetical protein AeMF1_021852 [Aphanomyces euteiches]KAH9192099.1 hypothetical protein AeNC1_005915 [Aphanomyces euteiches]
MSGRAGPPGSDFAHLQQDNAEIERSMLAQEVEALRSRLGLRQVDVSKECGVNASMLSQWMLGRYKGNIARINGLMETWLVNRRGGKPLDKTNMIMQSTIRAAHDMIDPAHQVKRKPAIELAERPLYKYPKITKSETCLVPIRLDVDVDGYRYIDSLSYNIYESDYTYETFSASLIRDLDLPECFYVPITEAIRKQVEQAKPFLLSSTTSSTSSSNSTSASHLCPIFIKLRLNDTVLIDSFEWDVKNTANDPDHFARVLCAEVGLSGEFQVQIALSIREQLVVHARKERLNDTSSNLPHVVQPLRDMEEAKLWEPKVRYIVADDIPLLEREDFKRMRPTSMPAPPQPAVMMPYFPVRSIPYQASGATAVPMTEVSKPNRPPKPVNTFLIFCRQWRKKLMVQNPNASAKEASRLLGEMWQKLTEEQRASYQPLADKENAQRMVEWKQKENADAGKPPASKSSSPYVGKASSPAPPSSKEDMDEDDDDDDENELEEDDDDEMEEEDDE